MFEGWLLKTKYFPVLRLFLLQVLLAANLMHFFKKYYVRVFLALSFVAAITTASAQLRTVTISVTNTDQLPVSFATVTVASVTDTAITLQKVTDSSGNVAFQLENSLSYHILITSVNYTPNEKRIIVTGNNTFFITLKPSRAQLSAVTVTTTRPLMRQEDDKTIVDPENLAASSTNAFEILEKTPGLFVDQDGNVYLSSTTPARIYINGREQRMSTADIATMLRSLPPNSILSIEILRTPSAKYDASGSGGIVNVVLKKGVRIGLTGSVTAGVNQGVYGNQFIGANLNNSSGKLNSYVNIQYNRRNTYDQIRTDRLFASDSILKQDATTTHPGSSGYIGAGFGYEINKKWEIGYDGRLNINKSDNSTINGSGISKISNGELITSNIANVENNSKSFSVSQSISSKYKIDSTGSEWTNDLSYTGNPNTASQNFITNFTRPNRAPFEGYGDVKTTFNFFSAASNVLWKLPKRFLLKQVLNQL